MKIRDFIPENPGSLILKGVLLLTVNSAQAATTYNFTSAPFTEYIRNLGTTGREEAYNLPGDNFGQIGNTINTSLTFASKLNPATTTTFSAESGSNEHGFDFFGKPTAGNLEDYAAPFVYSSALELTSDINTYAFNNEPATDGILPIGFYSTAEGEVTTDNSGNIVDWDIVYEVFHVADGSVVRIDPAAETIPAPSRGNTVGIVHISSSRLPAETTINPAALNGRENREGVDFTFNENGDLAFGLNSNVDDNFFTSEKGGFVPINTGTVQPPIDTGSPVPIPGAVWLFGTALAGLVVRKKNSCLNVKRSTIKISS